MATTAKKLFVYSMLANSQLYQLHGAAAAPGVPPPVVGEVLVRGGAGVADKRADTPEGAIVTPITREEADMLNKNAVFKLHEKNGFVRIHDEDVGGVKGADGLNGREPGSPTVPSDFEVKGAEVVKQVVKLVEKKEAA